MPPVPGSLLAEALLLAALALAAFGCAFLSVVLRRSEALARERDALLERVRDEPASAPPADAVDGATLRRLADVSHEFRTPLNGILGMTALLADTPLTPEQKTYVAAVRSSGEAFLRLVEGVLDAARPEPDAVDLADEPVDLPDLLQGVVELLGPRAQGKGLAIAALVDPSAPRTIRGDSGRLRQVLLNVVGNAVKFTEAGGVGVTLARGPGGGVAVLVEDTGPGVEPERREAIFEPFAQGGLPGEAAIGTGLGLAIARRLLGRMGGAVRAEDRPGGGARFVLTLPAPGAPAPPVAETAPTGRRALLLAPAPFEGEFLARTLEAAGVEAVRADDLPAALAALRRERFDVAIADWGAAADVRLLAAEARRRGVGRSVVLLSPFERRDLGSPHAAGFDAFLIKPVRPGSLLERAVGEPAPASGPLPADDGAPAPPSVAPRRGLRVLLAEDDPVNALVAVRTLERLGAVVEWARNGRDAVDRVAAAADGTGLPFDVVLMDLRMPGLGGSAAARLVREAEAGRPGSGRLRIVALSADAARAGDGPPSPDFDAALPKPLDADALRAALWPDERGSMSRKRGASGS